MAALQVLLLKIEAIASRSESLRRVIVDYLRSLQLRKEYRTQFLYFPPDGIHRFIKFNHCITIILLLLGISPYLVLLLPQDDLLDKRPRRFTLEHRQGFSLPPHCLLADRVVLPWPEGFSALCAILEPFLLRPARIITRHICLFDIVHPRSDIFIATNIHPPVAIDPLMLYRDFPLATSLSVHPEVLRVLLF